MTRFVPTGEIEAIVGARRDPSRHLARAVSDEEMVYILHSADCLGTGIDLRDCEYSIALDQGIDLDVWDGFEDRAVHVSILNGTLIPLEEVQRG